MEKTDGMTGLETGLRLDLKPELPRGMAGAAEVDVIALLAGQEKGKDKEREIQQAQEGMNELVRYDRQKKIWGEEGQQKIERAKITIIGSGYGAYYTALPLVALGVGEIRILGTGKMQQEDCALDMHLTDIQRVQAYEQAFAQLNPNCRVVGIPVDLETRLAQDFLKQSDIVIDVTNNARSKVLALEYAQAQSIQFISAGISHNYAKLLLWNVDLFDEERDVEYLMTQFKGKEQGGLLSLLWGGVIAEEVKKIILDENYEKFLSKSLYYKLGSPERFAFMRKGEVLEEIDLQRYKNTKALVIGAGALGNMMTIALGHLGIGSVDYVDYDTVESHNLNRQVLFYDAVGKEKAKVLAQKHRVINPFAETRGFVEKFELTEGKFSVETFSDTTYDIIFDLVDNLYARAVISAYATLRNIPLISAASSPDAAQVAVYVPGKSSCLDHVFSGYYENGRKEEIIRRQSCIAQPNPSVIMTNQVGAALAALEACTIIESDRFHPINGSMKYATELESRLGMTPLRTVCDCYAHPERIPDLEIRD